MNKYKYIGVRLPQAADKRVSEISERRGIPPAVLIRSIVMGYLEEEYDPAVDAIVPTATSTTGAQHTSNKEMSANGI